MKTTFVVTCLDEDAPYVAETIKAALTRCEDSQIQQAGAVRRKRKAKPAEGEA